MATRICFQDYREPAAAEAYDIAFDFLTRSGEVADEFDAYVFLAQRIIAMVDRGETNKIRIANRAIAQYQARARQRYAA